MATVAAPAMAGSFYLQEQSVRGAGRAYSGETADIGVSSLWWNPAAIARSGREAYFGVHGLWLDSSVRDTGSTLTRPIIPGGLTTPVGGDPRAIDPIDNGVVPNVAIAIPLGERAAFGFAVSAPYNFTTEYNPSAFTRYDAIKSDLRTVDAQATLAVQATDWLDLGVGVSAEYTEAELTSALPNLDPAAPDGFSSLEGDGVDFGWSVGAQVHRGPWNLGLSYKSAVEHELEGRVINSGLLGPLAVGNIDAAGDASFTTPWIASAGVRYDVNERWTLNAQVNRIGWSEFDAIRVTYPGGGQTTVQAYDDVTTGAVGVDYRATDKVTLRAGVAYDPTPTPDTLRTARIPDANRWLYSAGASVEVRPNVTLDAAVTYIAMEETDLFDDRIIYPGTGADTLSSLRGVAEGQGLVASVGARWRF